MPSLPSMQRRVPPGHVTKSSILYLHSPIVRPKDIVWLSGDPLIQDSLNHHHAVVLTKLSLGLSWIKSTRDVTELNVCRSRRCRAFGTWISWIAKTFDYINRVTKRFRFRSTRVPGLTLPARCYASPRLILRDRRNFFEILCSPTYSPSGLPRVAS